MIHTFFCLSLLLSVTAPVVARETRAERVKAHKTTQQKFRTDLDTKYKKARTIDTIASAQQESQVLAREALVSSWAQREQERLARHRSWGKFAHTYTSPEWTAATQRFFGTHSAEIGYSFSHVSQGFNDAGSVVDSSIVRFGKQPTLGDILLASKLAVIDQTEPVPAAGHEFLMDLSNIAMPFQASIDTHECNLTYRLGFARNRVQFGVRVPLREQIRRLHMAPQLHPTTQDLLRSRVVVTDIDDTTTILRNNIFRDQYGLSIQEMMRDIVIAKNMIYRDYLSHASIGDVSFFTTVNFFPWRLDRWTVGAELIVPGEKQVDSNYFYPIVPESGGFLSAKLSTGFVGRKTAIGSPHFMVSGQAYVPTSIKTRVPRLVKATNVSHLPVAEVFSQDVLFIPSRNILMPETTIADFASETAVATMRPGFALDCTIGTVLQPFISPFLELDVFYHFHMRGSDEMHSGLSPDDWHTDALLSAIYRAQHRLGFSLVYQPTSHVALRTGFNGVVAGRSAPLEVKAHASIAWSW